MAETRLIDLTRLASRVGQGALTGIDRVELAWAEHLLTLKDPFFALVRMRLGFALLDLSGIAALLDRVLGGQALGKTDVLGRILWRGAPHRARVEADLRRFAVKRASRFGLRRMLRRLGPGFEYFNLGHANLTPATLRAIKGAGGRITVLIHDTIPLDYPEFTRAGIPAVFARKLAAVSAHADRVIHTTHAARQDSEGHFARAGRIPPGVVANLGITSVAADAAQLPKDFDLNQPFVLALGTIEPRKNLGLLCDVWSQEKALPHLFVVGNRGWAAPEFFDRLAKAPGVTLLGALPDAAVAALMDRAQALIFPTLAEGFGLPPLEAAARGLPVLCSDLPVLRELLHDFPVYLKPTDVYAWTKAIHALDKTGAGQRKADHDLTGKAGAIPTWEAHFNAILTRQATELSAETKANQGMSR